jgi:hypothetical protein
MPIRLPTNQVRSLWHQQYMPLGCSISNWWYFREMRREVNTRNCKIRYITSKQWNSIWWRDMYVGWETEFYRNVRKWQDWDTWLDYSIRQRIPPYVGNCSTYTECLLLLCPCIRSALLFCPWTWSISYFVHEQESCLIVVSVIRILSYYCVPAHGVSLVSLNTDCVLLLCPW